VIDSGAEVSLAAPPQLEQPTTSRSSGKDIRTIRMEGVSMNAADG
jgi:hypothetical protein